jgi:hypothetical protein
MSVEKTFRRTKYDRQEIILLLLGSGVFFLLGLIVSTDDRLSLRLLTCGMFLSGALVSGVAYISSYFAYLKLDAEAVEWRAAFNVHSLRRQEVLGWGLKTSKYGTHIEVRTLDGDLWRIKVSLFGGAQTALADWLNGLPDLEATDETFKNRALLTNPAFGPAEVREARIYNHKAFLGVLSGFSGMVAFWTLISGYPPVRVIALLIPLLVCGLPALSGGRWSFFGQPRRTLPVWHIAVWPVVTTALVAYFQFEPADEAAILGGGLVAALGLLIVQKMGDRRVISWLILPVNLIYAFSTLTLANGAYETAPPQPFETEVLSKTSGRYGAKFVRVEPWGPVTQVRKLPIGTQTYRKTEPGDTLCLTLYTGALGWRYYDWEWCGPKAPPAAP